MQVQLILTASDPKEAKQLYHVTGLISAAIAGDSIESVPAPENLRLASPAGDSKAERKQRREQKKLEKAKLAPTAKTSVEPDDEDDEDKGLFDSVTLDDDDDADIDDLLTDDDEVEEKPAKEVAKEKKAPKLTLEGDIIPAFTSFVKKNDRKAAANLLEKFGVKSVRDIPTDDYKKFLKKISA